MTKKLGLVLGSGAARGWAHIGVLRALDEIGTKPDVIAGCSVGALVGGAHLIGALDEFDGWARMLKPLSTLQRFTLKVHRGGFIDTSPAFEAFRDYDQNIEDLSTKFVAVAADLGTGEEIAITKGSVIDAARASSAIPVVFHAVRMEGRWLVDGALANPAPVSGARALGADVVIAVDLNAVPRVLDRFDAPPPSVPAVLPKDEPSPEGVTGAVAKLIDDTRAAIERQFEFAKARANAQPHLFETAYAAADIFQMQLARARAQVDPPDICVQPDMRDAMPTAFDRADEFIAEGYRAMMEQSHVVERLLKS
ncbi:patatin-like phospholipase family protein [Hyphococcus flavus]|uniref:Patatin-like phospholipase family protein n=1 Tax=Hyphococcus flavus TaxID=1866326 RepID=A0AAE9ZHP5_9PROT|nr:patatin-like phospholipase family protein [Hyphococcus flavus]WDI32797.1 patatin-like phospholipase family protein [Hyphococcus flavus]